MARPRAAGRGAGRAGGDAAAIERLAEWLRTGSPMARVDAVVRSAPADADVRDAVAGAGFRVG
ncbi:MAG: hypothetical protein ACTHOH_12660 [Lysobacteraceae bacterium]